MSEAYHTILLHYQSISTPEKVAILQQFFKTGKGEYGEGDQFLGITVPVQRTFAKSILDSSFELIEELLASPWHECRLTALIILVERMKRSKKEEDRTKIFNFYIAHTEAINNWDLVDLSAPSIVGIFLADKPKDLLYEMIRREDLWQPRIAILGTMPWVRKGQFAETLDFSEVLMERCEDLLHKAAGWLLREVGKKSRETLLSFLDRNAARMPRVMLRYAVEHLPREQRLFYYEAKKRVC